MKKCSLCKKTKLKTKYGKRKIAKDGLNSQCNKCRQKSTQKWKRTKEGIISVIYSNQKTHSKSRGHRPPEYTKEELTEWLYSQKEFHEIHKEWAEGGYNKRLTPSVDRLIDTVHYCFGNIQLLTWRENNIKDNAGRYQDDHGHKTSKRWDHGN